MRLRWFLAVVLFALCLNSFTPSDGWAQESPALVDIAAMALTPIDLGSNTLTIFRSRSFTGAQRAAEVGPYIGLDVPSAQRSMERYGFLNGYELSLAAPLDASVEQPQARLVITSYVMQFDTDLGARKAFKLFEDESVVATAADIKGSGKIADRSEITTDSGVAGDSGVPLQVMDLSFVDGQYYAGVALIAYDWGDAAAPDESLPALSTDVVEGFANTLREKIASVSADGAPGLSNTILRMVSDQPTAVDFYEAMDGRASLIFGEGLNEVQPERFTGVVRSYRVEQSLGTPYYQAELLQFGSPEEASAWMAADVNLVSDALPGYSGVTDIPTTQVYGEESRGKSYVYQADDANSVTGFALYARVGTIVAVVQLDAAPSVAIEAAESMLASQVDCVNAGGVCPALVAPETIVQAGP